MIAAGNAIIGKPYRYGGGHGKFEDSAYDCSGSVSYALHGGDLLDKPLDSTDFESFGRRRCRAVWITIYANSGHAFMVVAGLRFDTGYHDSSSTGPQWNTAMRPSSGYVVAPSRRPLVVLAASDDGRSRRRRRPGGASCEEEQRDHEADDADDHQDQADGRDRRCQ